MTTFVTSGQLLTMNIISRHSYLYFLPSVLNSWSNSPAASTYQPPSPDLRNRSVTSLPEPESCPSGKHDPGENGTSTRSSDCSKSRKKSYLQMRGPTLPCKEHKKACDKEIEQPNERVPDASLILAWAQKCEPPSTAENRTRTTLFLHCITACAAIAGLSAGLGTGAAVFWYDGSQPINILAVLSSLVLAPALLLIPTILLKIGSLVMRRFQIKRATPSVPALSKALRATISKILPQGRELFTKASTLTAFHLALYGKVEALYLSLMSQLFTLSLLFAAGGYGTWKMITTDLAFCWSATPALITPALVQYTTSILAIPWSFLDAAATPSLQLIEKTRYYRFHAPLPSALVYDPAVMGEWWAFLILTILTWAVLPRLILLLITYAHYAKAISYTLRHLPHVPALLAELRPGGVYTTNTPDRSAQASTPQRQNITDNLDTALIQIPSVTASSKIIAWAIQDLNPNLLTLPPQLSHISPTHAGGTTPTSEELAVIEAVGNAPPPDVILILVKSWEPPLLEFIDFLSDLRKATQKTTPIYVIPLTLDREKADNTVWIKVLGKLADPWIHVTSSLSISK